MNSLMSKYFSLCNSTEIAEMHEIKLHYLYIADACYIDKDCDTVENAKHISDGPPRMNLYNILAKYQAQMDNSEQ